MRGPYQTRLRPSTNDQPIGEHLGASSTDCDTGGLITASAKANKRLATFGMNGEIRFFSPADRAAFTEELP
jgi:hypothetical protein